MLQFRPSQSVFRVVLRFIFSWFYRIRVEGLEHFPREGPALVVPNHVSWLDGILVQMLSPRPMCTIVYAGNFQHPLLRWWANRWDAILIGGGPKAIVRALRVAREALQRGEMVCIFAEGGITRTGQLQGFRPGLMKMLEGTSAPVIPVYLDELWGSIFSFEGGKFFWKWPKTWRYPISLFFGPPIETPRSAFEVRQAVQQLGESCRESTSTTVSIPSTCNGPYV